MVDKSTIKKQYDIFAKNATPLTYEYFDENYSLTALKELDPEELSIRLFASKEYAISNNCPKGFFGWAERGPVDERRTPFGTAKGYWGGQEGVLLFSDGQYRFYSYNKRGKAADISIIEKKDAIRIAEIVRSLFENCCSLISKSPLKTTKDYTDVLNKIKKHINSLDIQCLYWSPEGEPDGMMLKYFHCSFPEKFSCWYAKQKLEDVLKHLVSPEEIADSAFARSGQLSLYAGDIGATNQVFGEFAGSTLLYDDSKLQQLLHMYKNLIKKGGDKLFIGEELYKWEYITDNKDASALDIIKYLLDNNMNIYDRPRDSQCWKTLIKKNPQGLENVIDKLKDEAVSLEVRLSDFKIDMKKLLEDSSFSSCANDERTAACFLSCWNPQEYTLYKDEDLYDPLCKHLKIKKKSAGQKYEHYLELVGRLARIVGNDEEIQRIFKEKTNGLVQSNLLIAQTIIWCVFSEAGQRQLKGRFYWSGGIKWGSEDKTSEFISKNYWEIGWKDKEASKGARQAWANIKRIRVGDYIAFHSYGGTNDLTIHYLAEVTAVDEKKGILEIKKLPDENYYKGKAPKMSQGTWHGTLIPVTGEEAINTVFHTEGTTNNMMIIPEKIKEYGEILKAKKNVILQGAPGTGKTYSTAALALYIIADKEPDAIEDLDFTDHKEVMRRYDAYKDEKQIEFCTFHQSLDYEDFVEGLRPVVVDDGKSVAYDVHEGIFKRICNNADNAESNRVDNFNEAWDKLIETLNENDYVMIPLLSNKKKMRVELNEYGNGLTERTYPDDNYKKGEYIEGRSKFFSKDQLYNIYRGLPGVPAGGHDNYRKAIVAYMKAKLGLKDYKAGTKAKEQKNYVLIIDEINRGYVSKIFGELITLLEKDKRKGEGADHHIEVMLPYSNEPFSVPSNLYIIGTMNTTDRTTGTLDYALRRRFDFITVEADPSVLNSSIPESRVLFDDVKRFIEGKKLEDIDISDLMVGHSYFMATDTAELKRSIGYGVIPLVKEYIKDGLLNCLPSEANEYFDDWKDLKAHLIDG